MMPALLAGGAGYGGVGHGASRDSARRSGISGPAYFAMDHIGELHQKLLMWLVKILVVTSMSLSSLCSRHRPNEVRITVHQPHTATARVLLVLTTTVSLLYLCLALSCI